MRTHRALVVCLLVACPACGSPATTTRSDVASAGEETTATPTPPPAPPPGPAYVRIVHASPGPAAASISVALDDGAPVLEQLAFHQGSDYLETDAGTRAIVVQGVASVETGASAELARLTTSELAPDARYSIVVHGLPGEDPPLVASSLVDREAAPPEGAAGVRLFHALVGTDALDACVAGPGPRDPATPLFGALRYGALGGDASAPYVEIPAEGELALQIRAQHATPCRGRVIGVARTALTPGANHTLVLVGRASGRPRVERELVVCTEGEHASCIAVPVTAR